MLWESRFPCAVVNGRWDLLTPLYAQVDNKGGGTAYTVVCKTGSVRAVNTLTELTDPVLLVLCGGKDNVHSICNG